MNTGAIGQNATDLAPSLHGIENWDYDFSANYCSDRELKKETPTRERSMLNRQKMIEAMKNHFRTNFPAVFGKTERLPSDVFAKIEAACDRKINKRLAEITPANAVSYRRGFAFKSNDLSIVDRITLVGENMLTLDEQLLGVHIFQRQAEHRLEDLFKKKTPDHDREKAVRAHIAKLAVAEEFIKGEIAHQTKLADETKAS
jgi:hypothetical protein